MSTYQPRLEALRILNRLLPLVGKGKLGLTAVQYERLRRGNLGEHTTRRAVGR